MSLNGGYAMIKYNSTQEELSVAYKSKRPALFYDENQRAHWAVIEETARQSIDEETQEPITIYEYSYKLLDEANDVVANPTLSGDEATLNGLEVDGTKYKVGGSGGSEVHLYQHYITITFTHNDFHLGLLTPTNTPFTKDTLREFMFNDGNRIKLLCSGYYGDGKVAICITAINSDASKVTGCDITNNSYWSVDIENSSTSFTDTIIQIF